MLVLRENHAFMVEGKAYCSSPEAETWLEDTGCHDFEATQ